SKYTERDSTEWINVISAEVILSTEESRYPTLHLNKKSLEVLTGKRNVFMFSAAVPEQEVANYILELFNKLREVRMTLSKEFKVPPYDILSDATLRDMECNLPETKKDIHKIISI